MKTEDIIASQNPSHGHFPESGVIGAYASTVEPVYLVGHHGTNLKCPKVSDQLTCKGTLGPLPSVLITDIRVN